MSVKAWCVREKGEFTVQVVFAETRGKAKAIAQNVDDTLSCCDFLDLEATREKAADRFYKDGTTYMDWSDDVDRLNLVKYLEFRCEYIEPYLCESCSAKEICDDYAEWQEKQDGDSK